MTAHFLFENITCGFIPDVFQLLKHYELEHVVADFMNSGTFLSKYSWRTLINMKVKFYADTDIISEASSEGLGLFLAIQPSVKPSIFWEICRKYPNMLKACKSVVRLISLWINRLPERACSACESFTMNYVSHCLLWCNGNVSHRFKMWISICSKFGVEVYLRLNGFEKDELLSVLFGNYDFIADVLAADHKEQFYVFIARFIHILKTVCDGDI